MVRWVTSNAQLADCLSKSMDASILRQCLKSVRHSLFDGDRILQQRSDRRKQLKWAREITSEKEKTETVLKCTDKADHDSWKQDSHGQVVRIHRIPRTQLFS